MSMQHVIETKLKGGLDSLHLEVINESHMHNVPPGAESHFKVVVVTERFRDKRLIDRHRLVNELLADELRGGLHALALHTMTPDEWFERSGRAPQSPQCMGGAKQSA